MIGTTDFLTVLIALGIVGIIVALYLIFKSPLALTKVSVGNTTIQAEIADTFPKQVRGLMFRKSLPSYGGMLFVFSHDDYYGIWMMNTSIPLDIVWIDSDHKIVDIVKNAPPCKILCPIYKPQQLARYVLEVNAGFADMHNVNIGINVEFKV